MQIEIINQTMEENGDVNEYVTIKKFPNSYSKQVFTQPNKDTIITKVVKRLPPAY